MANTPTRRVIAVEEHFVTDHYWSETEKLAVPPGEEPEHAFMLSFPRNGYMRPRLTNVQKRLEEMDAAGIDVSVLSLNPPGVQIYADTARASSLAKEMNDALAELIHQHPGRFAGIGAVAPQDPDAAAAEVTRVVRLSGNR
jgi:5-carboxyvanillate decarboxylase